MSHNVNYNVTWFHQFLLNTNLCEFRCWVNPQTSVFIEVLLYLITDRILGHEFAYHYNCHFHEYWCPRILMKSQYTDLMYFYRVIVAMTSALENYQVFHSQIFHICLKTFPRSVLILFCKSIWIPSVV